MHWYFKLLAHRPHLLIIFVGVLSIACIIVSLTARKLPDFSDPTLGFEARGTQIGQKLTAWRNLLEETSYSGKLVANPKDLIPDNNDENIIFPRKHTKNKSQNKNKKKKGKNKKKAEKLNEKLRAIKNGAQFTNDFSNGNIEEYDDNYDASNISRHDHWDYGKNMSYYNSTNSKNIEKKRKQWLVLKNYNPPSSAADMIHIATDGFFCESPNIEYSHFVVNRINHNLNETLFEVNALLAMCELEQQLINVDGYEDICQKEMTSNTCCRPWSISNYVALLSNKTSCFDLQEEDVNIVKTLLLDCYQYYHGFKLSNECTQNKCNVPNECAQHNAVYNILHYLADIEFIKLNSTTEYLKNAMIFFPIARSTKALGFYHNVMKNDLSNDLVKFVAMDMGLKNALFDECLLSDGWLVGLGGLFVFFSMWLYTKSFFITFMTVIAILFSLGIAYFIYTLIFELTFFPFMNLLAVIVVVGIGADDAFIFIKIWQCVLADRVKSSGVPLTPSSSSYTSENIHQHTDSLAGIMAGTLRHAAVSMLVTSITTSAAFFASYVSSITAVRCFGIFAGTAVIANYCLMMTWLPASASIAERFQCLSWKYLTHKICSPFNRISQLCTKIETILISIVMNFPVLLVILLGLIGVISGILVLYWPKLRLPDSPDFKLFVSNHPFEIYDYDYKNLFWFEKLYTSTDSFKLPLRFVWGIVPVDRGNYLNPASRGELLFDDSFNISLPESQEFLLKFCKNLKRQPFLQLSLGLLLPNCFIENFISWMGRRCNDSMSGINREPCCEISQFPFEPEIFDQCIIESISSLYETPREFFMPGVAGPKFLRPAIDENGNVTLSKSIIKSIVVEYDSTQAYTMSYSEMTNFVDTVENWLKNETIGAPAGMKNVFFTSELQFFDLQDTLSIGTLIAIFVAMSVSLVVLLVVTLNILISFFAIITVTFTIFTTIAILILLGWKLNVLESVAVSTAIGLAVDFSLHYSVQYRLSPEPNRKSSARFSLSRMIGPTAMAATTTGVAGALMLPSNVLAYIQIGVFLVVAMTISWIYSTFFLMSLLSIIGPEYGFGQFNYPKINLNKSKEMNNMLIIQASNSNDSHKQNDKSLALLSASSSAAGDFINSESHELDSLTSNSIIKPVGSFSNKKKPRENSPSTASAITVVLPDDC